MGVPSQTIFRGVGTGTFFGIPSVHTIGLLSTVVERTDIFPLVAAGYRRSLLVSLLERPNEYEALSWAFHKVNMWRFLFTARSDKGVLFTSRWASGVPAIISLMFSTVDAWETDPFCILQMVRGNYGCDGCAVEKSGAFSPSDRSFLRGFCRCRGSNPVKWVRESLCSPGTYVKPNGPAVTTKGFAFGLGEFFLPELLTVKKFIEEKKHERSDG